MNKQQTANEQGQQFFWFIFYKNETKTSSNRNYNASNTLQLAIKVSFAVSLSLRTPFRKIISGLTFK